MPKPRQQASLHAFFGAAKSKKPNATKATTPEATKTNDDDKVDADAAATAADVVAPSTTSIKGSNKKLKDTENQENTKTPDSSPSLGICSAEQEAAAPERTTDDVANAKKNKDNNGKEEDGTDSDKKKRSKNQARKSRLKKRRVIEDDSSDDEEFDDDGDKKMSIVDDDEEDDNPDDDNDDNKNDAKNDNEASKKAMTLPENSKGDKKEKNDTPKILAQTSSAAMSASATDKSNKDQTKDSNLTSKQNISPSVSKNDQTEGAKTNEDSAVADNTCASPTKKTRPDVKGSAFVKALKKNNSAIKTDEELMKEIDEVWDRSIDVDLPYTILCDALTKIEAITGRLQIQEILTSLLRKVILAAVTPMDVCYLLYLASNSVAPAYKCVELGIGDAILIKAISEATGTSLNAIKQKYEAEGDLGIVAQNCKGKQKTLGGFFKAKPNAATATATNKKKKSLSVKQVLTVFREIAQTKGNQSQKWKVDKIKGLLVQADSASAETRYIIRGLQGKLRIGLAESTVIISLAHALAMTVPRTVVGSKDSTEDSMGDDEDIPEEAQQYINKSTTPEKRLEAAVAILKKAYSEVPSYDALWEAACKVPLHKLHKACTLTPGIPVCPMLAKPTKSIQEVLQRLNGLRFTCEYKYDGERAQVHLLPDGKTRVFSRNLLDTSEKYPEVPMFVREACKDVESFVLDAEVVAFNNKTGQLVPFQILSTRKKTEESAESAKVQVIVQAFDLMYLNGKSLLQKTLAERRKLLHEHFLPVPGKFQFAKSIDHQENGDTQIIEEFLDAAVKGQCEGLMVKTLDVNAIYEPSRRSLNWLKLKKDYLEGLGDSVDLVPLGAYHGRGKRTGVYGAYLLACYDPDTEEFQSVCKIGTGFSDEALKTFSETLKKHIIPKKSSQYNVSDQLECDVWFDAVQVWEVKAADLSKSSAHRGAEGKTGEEGRGIGLRFPRFERIREDKRPDEATTSDQILEMYYNQDTIVGEAGGDDGI